MCEAIYIGNTQHTFNEIMDGHFPDILRPLKYGKILISYFSASGNALLSGPKIVLGGRTDIRTDVRPATCNI